MSDSNRQVEQIQKIIDKIHHHLIYSDDHLTDYEILLFLSTHANYPYGEAIAHAYLAQHALLTQNNEAYLEHLHESKRIALKRDFFDVQIKCLHVEGNRNRGNCNEMAALTYYLKGLKLATKINDMQACSIFYMDIADLFYDCGAYVDTELFLQKALKLLEEHCMPNRDVYRKHIMIQLLRLSCIHCEMKKAKHYYQACVNLPGEIGNLPLLFKIEEIRYSLFCGETLSAKQKVEEFMQSLSQDRNNVVTLKPVFLFGMDLLLSMKEQAEATWIMNQIDSNYTHVSRKTALHLQKLRVQYAITFDLMNDSVYQDFYSIAQQGEADNRIATAETFQSMIALYENAKEHNLMMEKRTHLQIAVDKDELTQIYNRRYLSKLLSKYLQDDRIQSLDCVMIDIDYFKGYNDYYGHPKGDQVLKEVASTLVSCIPQEAFAIRYGGDEFSCLFVNTSEKEIVDFVLRVQANLKEKKIQHLKNLNGDILTLSFGTYHETNLSECDEFQILNRADQALYQAKENGRNTYVIYTNGGTHNV